MVVRDGYAITCEGDDIRVDAEETIDVFDLIASDIGFPAASPLTSPVGVPDTDVSLVLDSNPASTRRFRVEAYKPKKHDPKSLLKGTLLMDFFEDCIQSILDFVKGEFTPAPGEANLPVGPTQKRVTTFLNLLIQLVNKQNGAFVFLSGEKAQAGPNLEDTILRNFYAKLREKLQSHTFCAMFDGARPYPEYPYAGPGMTTIFGKGSKTRVRIAPGSSVGYTAGGGTTINVFDLEKGEMIEELAFPGGPGAVVQDVAVSRDGRQLYASALINDRDTMFAVADITGNGQVHTFRAPTLICDQLLVTLGVSTNFDSVYAIGKGKDPGLYVINPQNVDPNIKPTYKFNAVGHLAFDVDGRAVFATKSSGA